MDSIKMFPIFGVSVIGLSRRCKRKQTSIEIIFGNPINKKDFIILGIHKIVGFKQIFEIAALCFVVLIYLDVFQ